MADVAQLEKQLLDFCASIFQEEFLDDQFVKVYNVDGSDPNFVGEVFSVYFKQSENLLNHLSEALEQQNVDFGRVHVFIDELKRRCANVGCHRVKNACDAFIDICKEQNVERCKNFLQQVKDENLLLKSKFLKVHELAQEVVAAGGSIPFPKQ